MSSNDQEEIKKYKDGVWAFLLEHSRILDSGKIRVIFDTDGQPNFEKRVMARVKYNYHREDYVAKEKGAMAKREIFISEKQAKRDRYKADKKERSEKSQQIKKEVERVARFNARPRWQQFLLKLFRRI